MTDLELLIDFHLNAGRQGPGSDADTLRALSFIDREPGRPLTVADIGCGSGAQTMALARNLEGHITAVDLFPAFLEKLKERAERLGLGGKISVLEGSMDDLPFGEEEFDIIWSEGAVYNMGFEAGISYWKRFLKTGGCIAVSELTWKTKIRPEEIDEYWRREYPEIDTASGKIRVLEENGFSPSGFFFLPESSWIDGYYGPMEGRFDDFLRRHGNSDAAQSLVENEREEIRLYRTYREYLSYGFYIAVKLPGA